MENERREQQRAGEEEALMGDYHHLLMNLVGEESFSFHMNGGQATIRMRGAK